MGLLKIFKYSSIFLIAVSSQFYIEHINASETEVKSDHHYQEFIPPDRTTPENAVRTFWWAMHLRNNDVIKECINEKRLLEEYHGWTLETFLMNYQHLNPKTFKYSTNYNFIRITSPEHNMDYEMEVDEQGLWVIVGMRP